jgi:AcrR family transcriptional regulator
MARSARKRAASKSTGRPVGRPRKAVADADKRQAVLRAALALMAERGFYGAAMPEIAAAARVGVGTIYRYFADKESLGNALYRQGKQALTDALWSDLPRAAGPEGWQAVFGEIWRRLMQFARREPLMLRFLEQHYHASYLDAESLALEQQSHAPAIAYLQDAIAAGAVRRLPPELLAELVWSMLIATCANADNLARPDLIDAAGQCAWAAIANSPVNSPVNHPVNQQEIT